MRTQPARGWSLRELAAKTRSNTSSVNAALRTAVTQSKGVAKGATPGIYKLAGTVPLGAGRPGRHTGAPATHTHTLADFGTHKRCVNCRHRREHTDRTPWSRVCKAA